MKVCHIWYIDVLQTKIYRQCMSLYLSIDILCIHILFGTVCAKAGREILEGKLFPPGAE